MTFVDSLADGILSINKESIYEFIHLDKMKESQESHLDS